MATINKYAHQVIYGDVDINHYELLKARVENLSAEPSGAYNVAGSVYYNTTTGQFGYYDAVQAAWVYPGAPVAFTWRNSALYDLGYLGSTAPGASSGLTPGEVFFDQVGLNVYTALTSSTWSTATAVADGESLIFKTSGTGTVTGGSATATQNIYTNDGGTTVTYVPTIGDAIIDQNQLTGFYVFSGSGWDFISGDVGLTASQGVRIVSDNIEMAINNLSSGTVDTSSTTGDLFAFYDSGASPDHKNITAFAFINSLRQGTVLQQNASTGKLEVIAATQVQAQTATDTTNVITSAALAGAVWSKEITFDAIDWVLDGSGTAYEIVYAANDTNFTSITSITAVDGSGNTVEYAYTISGGAFTVSSNVNTTTGSFFIGGSGYTAP